MNFPEIQKAIYHLEMPKSTMNIMDISNGITLIDDTYNINEN